MVAMFCTLPLFHLKLNGLPRHQVASHPIPYTIWHITVISPYPPYPYIVSTSSLSILSPFPPSPLSIHPIPFPSSSSSSLSPPSQKRTRKVVRCLLEHEVHAGKNPCGSSVRQQVNTGSHSTTTGECHLSKNML